MKCPKCGSEHAQYYTVTTGGGFSASDACCGYIMLGPLGFLCGSCGSSESTREYWVCHDCGHQFSTGAATRNLEKIKQATEEKENYERTKAQLQEALDENGGYDAVVQAHKEAKAQLKIAEDEYNSYLQILRENSDESISSAAKWVGKSAASSAVVYATIAGLIFLFIYFPVGLAILALAIPAIILFSHKEKQGIALLSEKLPGFVERKAALDEATKAEKRLNTIISNKNSVETYEREHKE